jgi:hypothetical protein
VEQKKSDWYRQQAAACAAMAEKATHPQIKALNQAEADRWLRLAELVEKQSSDGGTSS